MQRGVWLWLFRFALAFLIRVDCLTRLSQFPLPILPVLYPIWRQYPEDLPKVEQLKLRTARKKASVDLRLKTAVQCQLDDVKYGMQLLQTSLEDINDIRSKSVLTPAKSIKCGVDNAKLTT